MGFTRSSAACPTRHDLTKGDGYYREQVNQLTAFIDASQVYGSSEEDAIVLRADGNGRLAMGDKDLLPRDPASEECVGEEQCFLAGDSRVNEQVGLTAFHTIFNREHNRIADEIQRLNPDFSAERVYQEARKIVGAEMQVRLYVSIIMIR